MTEVEGWSWTVARARLVAFLDAAALELRIVAVFVCL